MDALLIATRATLVVVFAVAALVTLFDIAGSRRTLESFGMPGPLVAPAATVLPVLELTAAALLAVAPTARAGAVLASVLLVSFTAAIAVALRRRVAPECHCFGQLHSQPVNWTTVARNVALALAAGLVLAAGPGPGISSWLSHANGTTVALVSVGLLTIVLVHAAFSLWHQNRLLTGAGRASAAPVALQVGQAVPQVEVLTADGTKVAVGGMLEADRRTIFVFTNASCAPSVELLPELARWREVLRGGLDIHVLAAGDEQENRQLAAEHGIPVLLDDEGAAVRAFGVEGTPGAIEIDATGRVAAPPALGGPAIEGLIRAALDRPPEPPGLGVRYVTGNIGARPAGAAS